MLEFILKTDDKTIINDKTEYTNNNDVLRFRINNETFKFYIKEKKFVKLSKDTKVVIDLNNKNMLIDLIDIDQQFVTGIFVEVLEISNNIINFKYEILDEKEKINEVTIKY